MALDQQTWKLFVKGRKHKNGEVSDHSLQLTPMPKWLMKFQKQHKQNNVTTLRSTVFYSHDFEIKYEL